MKVLSTSLVGIILSAASIHGAQFSSIPTIDAFVTTGPNGELANNNYGGGGSISMAAAGQEMGEAQAVLQFNLAGAMSAFDTQFGAGQWSVQSVSLQLTAAPANNPIFNSPLPGTFGISWMQNDSWQEGTGRPDAPTTSGITFNSLQTVFMGPGDQNLGLFAFDGRTSGASIHNLRLESGLTSDILSGGLASFRLFAADSTMSGVFNSRSFSIAANRPVLTVVAVPEPSTIALAVLGLGTFVISVFARRKR